MINQETGEIDTIAVAERADLRACREWGGSSPPPSYIRDAVSWCWDRARNERLEWRRMRGLPDDSPVEMISVPAWGSSGDNFGRGA
jgi:hypothetical protein